MRRGVQAVIGLLALGLVGSGCQKGTYLKLVFKGDGLPAIHHIQVGLKLADGRAAIGSLPRNPPATNGVKMPASAVFILDDYSGVVNIDASAYAATNTLLASDHATTTIAHATSWEVELNFSPGVVSVLGAPVADAPPVTDATPIMDATFVDLGLPDLLGATTDGSASGNGDIGAGRASALR